MKEFLGKGFDGIIVSDGWSSYPTNLLSPDSGFIPVFSHTTMAENFEDLDYYPNLKIFSFSTTVG